ncbi:MAG: phosphoribosyl-ATP diphosphatase [Spirochaetaceae bacterium]|jgi:phosphoribosyl-ATP pyrophosphohydrolase/phosphoribosyl-AMP cyclohydrolase|nr:phosphoribosyl-ATP diphosphatase [Spirochaetaceae bacterium]
MVVASIDIQNGQVVQLKQGEELVLRRDDALALAQEFDKYGEVAVIDLDAAMGKGSNIEMMKPLFRAARCRVGGGIRSVEQAVELVSLGAEKIIIGSTAFRCPGKDGFAVNTVFLKELALKIGRERLIVAVDSRGDTIVVDGWKTDTGLPLVECAAELEEYAGELLWTCVEREGTMTGINIARLYALRGRVSCQITAAGGVSTLAELEEIAQAGCDTQLGMALYTGKIKLADAFSVSLNWKKGIPDTVFKEDVRHNPAERPTRMLLPIVVQSEDGQLLMSAYTDKEALSESFARGNLCFYSRSREKLWMKGESSGNTLKLLRLRADCDRDALSALVRPTGPVCHTGAYSCFETGQQYSLGYLQSVINERLSALGSDSYTASLSTDKVKRKVMEEAYEICTARSRDESVWEAADLFFHTILLLSKEGIAIDEVLAELDRRHKEDRAKKKRFIG